MVELIEALIGVFLAGVVLLELTGKTDLLGRRRRQQLIDKTREERAEESETDDERPF